MLGTPAFKRKRGNLQKTAPKVIVDTQVEEVPEHSGTFRETR
jgi:hypothetical protein